MVRRFRSLLLVMVVASSFLIVAPVSAVDPECTITGTEGDDVLSGTADADVICGLGGDDEIDAGDGDDVVFGGTGSDVIYGGLGNDEIHGNEDADELYGDEGDDWLGGGKGDDVLHGGDGADVMEGKTGSDVLYGGPGDDELAGNEDPDELHGEAGDDLLGGGKADDVLSGGDGDDILVGRKGDDILFGDAGVDSADGSEGTDVCVAESEVSCEEDPSTPTAVTFTHPVGGATVFHVETVTVAVEPAGVEGVVELSMDGAEVGTAPIVDGSVSFEWDTTTVEDGGLVLTAAVFDAGGNPAVSAEVSVAAGNESTGTIDRIFEDHENGLLTADEYATLGIRALCCAQTLDARYQSEAATLFGEPIDPDDPIDGTQLALAFLSEWEDLSQSVRDDVLSIGTIVHVPAAAAAVPVARAAPQATQGPVAYSAACHFDDPWRITVGFPVEWSTESFQCRVESPHFEVFYNEIEQGGVFPAEAIHGATTHGELADVDPANGIPDYVDVIVVEMENARSVYEGMTYDLPVMRKVVIHDLLGPSPTDGYTTPKLVQYERGLNYRWDVDGDGANDDTFLPSQYLPRHETFHVSQWEYVSLGDVAVPSRRIRWMMEATAEWATHKVNEQHTATDDSGMRYARKLALQLGSPERLTETGFPFWVPDRSYGAFIFFEYLEEYFAAGGNPDSDIVRRIWDITGDGIFSKAATVAIDETIQAAGGTLADVLTASGLANYRIDHTYTDANDTAWADKLDGRRPGIRNSYTLGPDDADLEGTVRLGDGGTAYIEFTSDPGVSGTLTLTATLPGDVSGRVLEIDGHPDLCAGANANGRVVGEVPTVVHLSDTCPTATLVLTYESLPNSDTFASWQATFEGSPMRLVAQGTEYLWEYDGVSWTQLPAVPGVNPMVWDIETLNGEVFALVLGGSGDKVLRLAGSGAWVVAHDVGYPTRRPWQLAATRDHLYLLTEEGSTGDRVGVWRYDGDLSWTQVADIEGHHTGLAPTMVGGDPQVVFVVGIDPDPLNPTRSTIWAWSETDGLRQGVFETASGPEPVFEGRLGMRGSVDYQGEFIVSTPGGGFISTVDGLSWTLMPQPLGTASAMAAHDGLVYLADFSSGEIGTYEEPIRTWDGTSSQVVADPNPDMAWTSFQSDGDTLWMSGFRDIDDYTYTIVEAGVYRSTNGIDRVSLSTGTPDLGGYIGEILLVEPTP